MPWIAAKDLEPGLELSRDVINMHGQMLLAEGHRLSEQDMLFIAAWGILEVEVQALPASPPVHDDEGEASRRIRTTLESRFLRQDFSEPIVRQLFDACLLALEREERPSC